MPIMGIPMALAAAAQTGGVSGVATGLGAAGAGAGAGAAAGVGDTIASFLSSLLGGGEDEEGGVPQAPPLPMRLLNAIPKFRYSKGNFSISNDPAQRRLMEFFRKMSQGEEEDNPRKSKDQPRSKTEMASTPTGGIITLPPPSNFPFDMPMMNPILGQGQGSSIYA